MVDGCSADSVGAHLPGMHHIFTRSNALRSDCRARSRTSCERSNTTSCLQEPSSPLPLPARGWGVESNEAARPDHRPVDLRLALLLRGLARNRRLERRRAASRGGTGNTAESSAAAVSGQKGRVVGCAILKFTHILDTRISVHLQQVPLWRAQKSGLGQLLRRLKMAGLSALGRSAGNSSPGFRTTDPSSLTASARRPRRRQGIDERCCPSWCSPAEA